MIIHDKITFAMDCLIVTVTFIYQFKVEGLVLHCFCKSAFPPTVRALHLNDVCLPNQTVRGCTQDA